MQINTKFQSLIRGEEVGISQRELIEFENFCGEEAIIPEQFIKTVVALYKQKPEQALHFLQYVCEQVITKEKYNNSFYNEAKIRLYNYLTILTLGKATRTEQVQIAQNLLEVSKKYQSMTEGVNTNLNYATILSRAFIYYYEGNVAKSISIALKIQEEVKNTKMEKGIMTAVLILLAQCHFVKKGYEKSLQYYKKCFKRNNYLPIKARLGMAYCYFNLNKFEIAKACFERILQLDSKCYEAYIGLGLVYERSQNYQQYLKHIKQAYSLNKNHPLLLYLLAEHFLVRGQLLKCHQACNRGLKGLTLSPRFLKENNNLRNDYGELSNRFINMQGQTQHKGGNFAAAIEYYSKIAQRQLLWNDVSLVQCLIYTKNYKDAMERMQHTYKIYEKQKKDSRFLKDSYRLMAYLKHKCKQTKNDSKLLIHYYGEAMKYDKNDPDLKCEMSYHLTTIDQHHAWRVMQELEKLSQTINFQIKPEMMINIGVLALQNHEPEVAEIKLTKAIQHIQKWEDLDLVQQTGFLIIAKYNYGICLEHLHLYSKAINTYEEIIKSNKCHIDSYLRKAYVLHKLGNSIESLVTLSNAERICKKELVSTAQMEKIHILKAYILFLKGHGDQSLKLLTKLSQNKLENIYYKILEFAITYVHLFKQQLVNEKLQEFLKTTKEYCEKVCEKDGSSFFCYMVLIIVLANLKQLPKEQGALAFRNIQLNFNEMTSSIKYNMGLYYMCQNDEQAAITCFNQYRNETESNKANQLISYLYLINKDYKKCIKQTRRNILLDPSNIKYRAQLIYTTQVKCEEEFNSTNQRVFLAGCEQIQRCHKFHQFINSPSFYNVKKEPINSQQHLRIILRAVTQNMIVSAKQWMEKFQKKKRDLYQKEHPKNQKTHQFSGGNESQDEEQKRLRQNDQKRKKALAKAKVQNEKLKEAWTIINEKTKVVEEEKLKRRPQKSQDHQISPKHKSITVKQKKEETPKPETEDYYSVKKEKSSKQNLLKKEILTKEDQHSDTSSLRKYMVQ